MAQWGNTDDAANSVFWANTTLNLAKNQSELFANTTIGAATANVAQGIFGVSTDEMQGAPLLALAVTYGGNNYATAPTVTISAPDFAGGTQATATAILTSNAVSGFTITNDGQGYLSVPTVTLSGGNTTSDVATASATIDATEEGFVTHAGWVLRTEGQGGRAGRVQYETLVAMSSISTDSAKDDSVLPE